MKTIFLPIAILCAFLASCERVEPPASNEGSRDSAVARQDKATVAEVASEDSSARHSRCAASASFAGLIMVGRQNGVPIADLMENHSKDNDTASREHRKIIIYAYDRPRMNHEENQDKLVKDFENEVYLACYKQAG